jgi:DNA-binding Lrp family transcriptional regulator
MIKKKDLMLASYLRQDARIPLTTLSRKSGVPVSTIFDRIRSGAGEVILRATALLNYPKLGYHTRATVLIKAKKETKEQMRNFLMQSCNVNSLYKINNGYDFMADFIFRDACELEDFVSDLDEKFGVKVKDVHYIIEDLKQEDFLVRPDMVDMLFPAV